MVIFMIKKSLLCLCISMLLIGCNNSSLESTGSNESVTESNHSTIEETVSVEDSVGIVQDYFDINGTRVDLYKITLQELSEQMSLEIELDEPSKLTVGWLRQGLENSYIKTLLNGKDESGIVTAFTVYYVDDSLIVNNITPDMSADNLIELYGEPMLIKDGLYRWKIGEGSDNFERVLDVTFTDNGIDSITAREYIKRSTDGN